MFLIVSCIIFVGIFVERSFVESICISNDWHDIGKKNYRWSICFLYACTSRLTTLTTNIKAVFYQSDQSGSA